MAPSRYGRPMVAIKGGSPLASKFNLLFNKDTGPGPGAIKPEYKVLFSSMMSAHKGGSVQALSGVPLPNK